jgi:hypothetical protein
MGMLGHIARAVTKTDGVPFVGDLERFLKLVLAVLKPLARPTEAIVYAAHEAVWFVAYWAISDQRSPGFQEGCAGDDPDGDRLEVVAQTRTAAQKLDVTFSTHWKRKFLAPTQSALTECSASSLHSFHANSA